MALSLEARHALAQPVVGIGDIADVFAVSKQLASKWARTWPDWPQPYADIRAGLVWETQAVLAVAAEHERKPGEGPRAAGDPRPPSVAKKAARKKKAPA